MPQDCSSSRFLCTSANFSGEIVKGLLLNFSQSISLDLCLLVHKDRLKQLEAAQSNLFGHSRMCVLKQFEISAGVGY